MKILIFLFMLSAYAEENVETDNPLFGKKKADFLEKMKEKDDPGEQDIECVEGAANRNELNRCEKVRKGNKREEKKNPEKEESNSDE
jgi:hypothetical protein